MARNGCVCVCVRLLFLLQFDPGGESPLLRNLPPWEWAQRLRGVPATLAKVKQEMAEGAGSAWTIKCWGARDA